MELAQFVTALGERVVPGCEAGSVRHVLAVATAGAGEARLRDGRRASWLTPSGVPFEASVVGGGGRTHADLRYASEIGTAVPFFAARLGAQRAGLSELVAQLPLAAQSAAAALPQFVETLFPDPGAVPARTLFATSVGIVHREDQPRHLARLKVYGNLAAAPGGIGRLAAVWPAFGEMAARFEPGPDVRPHFAAVEVDATGDLGLKLYVGRRRTDAAHVRKLAADHGVADPVLEDIPDTAWTRPFAVCCSTSADVPVTLHLSLRALEPDPERRSGCARRLAERHHGSTALVDALAAATTAAGPDSAHAWRHTVAGFGFAPDGQVARLTLYFAPG